MNRPIAVAIAVNLLSYYEDDCRGIRPSTAAWTAFFGRLQRAQSG